MSLPKLQPKPDIGAYGSATRFDYAMHDWHADCARVLLVLLTEAMKYARHKGRCGFHDGEGGTTPCTCGLDALRAHIAGITPREEG